MQTLAVAATKGGAGKTTLAASLSIEASEHLKRVALIDLDPQQSLATWHQLRGSPAQPEMIPTGAKIGSAIGRLRSQPERPDLCLIDTPPALIRYADMAIDAADLVLVPCRASPLDVEAVDIMKELCEQAGKPFVFVVTATSPKRAMMTDGARDFLKERGPVLDVVTTDRMAYAQAMMGGKTGGEIDKAAKAETAALWVAIRKQLAAVSKVAAKKGASK